MAAARVPRSCKAISLYLALISLAGPAARGLRAAGPAVTKRRDRAVPDGAYAAAISALKAPGWRVKDTPVASTIPTGKMAVTR